MTDINQPSAIRSGFTIGEHSSSRSLFGLRKSQIAGELASLILGFVALLGLGSSDGILAFAVTAICSSFVFLVGYKRRTLDQLVLDAFAHLGEQLSHSSREFRHDLFGFSSPPVAGSFVASSHTWGSRRISPSRKRRSRIAAVPGPRGSGLRNIWEKEIDDGAKIGIAREHSGKRSVVAFELFGDGFLLRDPQDQNGSAAVFGTMLGSMSSLSKKMDSVALIYLVDPERRASMADETLGWAGEVRKLFDYVSGNATDRHCYLVVHMADSPFGEQDFSELTSFVAGLGLDSQPLDGDSLGQLFAFGTGEGSGRGVLHVRSRWSHLLVGERLMKLFDVAEFPTGEVRPDFLVPFVTSLESKSLLSFRFKAIESHFALRKVRSRRSGITADAGIRALLGFLSRTSEARAISSLEVQENDLDMGYEMFAVSGFFAVFADSLYELKDAAESAMAKAEKSGLQLECAYGRQLQTRNLLFGRLG